MMLLPLHLSLVVSTSLAASLPTVSIDRRLLTAEELAADPVKSVAVVAFHVDNACGGTPQYLRMQNNTCFGPVNTQSNGRKITFKVVDVHPDCQVLAFADYPCQYGANHPAQSLKPEETCYDPSSAPKQPLSLAALCNIKLGSSDAAKQSLPPSALPAPQGTVAPQGQPLTPFDSSSSSSQAQDSGTTSSNTPVPVTNPPPSAAPPTSGSSTPADVNPALTPAGNGWGPVPPAFNTTSSSTTPADQAPAPRPSGSQTLTSVPEPLDPAPAALIISEVPIPSDSLPFPDQNQHQNQPILPSVRLAPPPDSPDSSTAPPADQQPDPSNLHPNDGWGKPQPPAANTPSTPPPALRRRQTSPPKDAPPKDAPPKDSPIDPSNLHWNDGWGPVPKGITPLPASQAPAAAPAVKRF